MIGREKEAPTEREMEILSKYKFGKEEMKAAGKDIASTLLTWFGAYSLVVVILVFIEEMNCGSATLSQMDGSVAFIVAVLVTWWIRKDVFILTNQEIDLFAERMTDEVYERAMERWRSER